MLDALEGSVSALDDSVHAQRQLVADASHELRTPVTSLRTNIEILQQREPTGPRRARRLIADVVEQIEELTLVQRPDRARPRRRAARRQRGGAPRRARLRGRRPGAQALSRVAASVELEPTLVTGVPARLDRAVNNLLDNAVKFARRTSRSRSSCTAAS